MNRHQLALAFVRGEGMPSAGNLRVIRPHAAAGKVLMSYDEPIAVRPDGEAGIYVLDRGMTPTTTKHIGVVVGATFRHRYDGERWGDAGERIEVVDISRPGIRALAGLVPDRPCRVRREGRRTVRAEDTVNGRAGTVVPMGEVA